MDTKPKPLNLLPFRNRDFINELSMLRDVDLKRLERSTGDQESAVTGERFFNLTAESPPDRRRCAGGY